MAPQEILSDEKYGESHQEDLHITSHDQIDEPNEDEHYALTEKENRNIRRKTDRVILLILVWVYFLQILDKSVLGYGALFGLEKDTHLTGNQYSLVGSIAPIAQLAWQPFSSVLIVKIPHRILMPCLILGWGIAQSSMAACENFKALLAARFFLGLFEAGCLPLFSVITSQWYRRAEQPLRVACWYGTNGVATIVAAALSFGLGKINSSLLRPWQIIFLFVGLVTIVTAPLVYWKLDNEISSARFLTERERLQAIERLRANQTGTGSREFKPKQVRELVFEPKTYLWIAMSLLLNVGAAVTNTFGPLILSGLGYDEYTTSLLNMPFGALQVIIILLGCFAAQKVQLKGLILAFTILPVIAGLATLYVVPRNSNENAALLVGYYLLAFLFGGNPLMVSWIVGNTAGTTKKSVIMSLYNAASAAGNIIGPLLFNEKDAPAYTAGLRAVLGIFISLAAVVLIQWANLIYLNKRQAKKRAEHGKPTKLVDYSMKMKYSGMEDKFNGEYLVERTQEPSGSNFGINKVPDLTDRENENFIFIY